MSDMHELRHQTVSLTRRREAATTLADKPATKPLRVEEFISRRVSADSDAVVRLTGLIGRNLGLTILAGVALQIN
jgi:hypothetical protein